MANEIVSGATQGAAAGSALGPWGAAIGGALGGISGLLGSRSSRRAAQQQQQAARDAMALQGQLRGDMQNRLMPYLGTGQTATEMLGQGLRDNSLTRAFTNEDFVKDPGYDWRMAEGTRAVEGGAAARGGLLSGAAAKALAKYGQGFASNEFDRAYGRFTNTQDRNFQKLFATAGLGQNAVGQSNAADQWYGNNAGGLMTGAGNAAAAGTIGGANAIAGGLGQAYNAWQDNQLLRMIGAGNRGGGFAGGNLGSQYGSGAYRSPWAGYGGEDS
jgi:hypothetical protein